MSNTEIAKTTVNLMTNLTIGTVTGNIIKSYRNHSDNQAIEIILDIATVVTSYAVADIVGEPVRRYTNEKVEVVSAWCTKVKTRKSAK